MNKRNIKLTIAYDGYGYHGWQVQPNHKTIEGEIENALKKLTSQNIDISGASRTDAGVSALGQVANFHINSPVPTKNFPKALNQILPDEIVIKRAEEVDKKFSARFDVKHKQYQYKIFTGKDKPVIDIRHCWWKPDKFNIDAIQKASKLLIGEKDFKSFASAADEREDTVRNLTKCDIEIEGDWIYITVEGNGFLYNMVRNIVGTLIEFGKEKWSPEYIEQILQAKDRTKAGPIAPAQGLCLMWIKY